MSHSIPKATVTILTIDDDAEVRSTLTRALKREGYYVLEAENASVALQLAQEQRPDLIILDITMPGVNGLELCRRLRSMPFVEHVPVLFLSVHQNAQSVAQALDSGGDDYLRKPFVTRELLARVRALLRRSVTRWQTAVPTLELDATRQCVILNGRTTVLTPTEFALLDYLCRNLDEHHTAPDLLQRVWGYPPGSGDTALVRNHIRNLRRKIELDPEHPAILTSLHGRGYAVQARVIFLNNQDSICTKSL